MKALIKILSTSFIIILLFAACGDKKGDTAVQTPNSNTEASPADQNSTVQSSSDEDTKTFTPEELAKYDGKDGRPAYIAVDGKVYDVTNSEMWKGGKHQGRFQAGKDYSEEIKNLSPHGASKLDGLPVVGEYK